MSCTGGRSLPPEALRQSATNSNLIWPRPPSAILRPPHLLIHVLADCPALSPHDRRHELRKHDRLDLDLRKHQFMGEMPLQCRLRDRPAVIASDAKANTILPSIPGYGISRSTCSRCQPSRRASSARVMPASDRAITSSTLSAVSSGSLTHSSPRRGAASRATGRGSGSPSLMRAAMASSIAETAWATASPSSAPKVVTSGKAGQVTCSVSLSSRVDWVWAFSLFPLGFAFHTGDPMDATKFRKAIERAPYARPSLASFNSFLASLRNLVACLGRLMIAAWRQSLRLGSRPRRRRRCVVVRSVPSSLSMTVVTARRDNVSSSAIHRDDLPALCSFRI